MGSRIWIVILSLVACSRSEPNADVSAAPPALDAGATSSASVSVAADAASSPVADSSVSPAADSSVSPAADATSLPEAARPPRKRVPVLDRRGDPGGPMPYRVVEPGDARPDLPLVIALHGRGDDAAGFCRFALSLSLPVRFIVPEGPLMFGLVGGRQWYEADTPQEKSQIAARVKDLVALTDALARDFPKAGRPAVVGFSQGAVIAFQAAHDAPDRFSAVAPLSGYLAIGEPPGPAPTRPLPVLVVAGTKDHIIPQERSWEAAVVLERQGLAVRRFTFVGPHSIPEPARDALADFLLETTTAEQSARPSPSPAGDTVP